MKCYITNCEISELIVHLQGYCDFPQPHGPSMLIEVTVRKLSWEDFQRRLDEWKFHEGLACTFMSKDEIYISEVVLNDDTERVRELEVRPAVEIEDYVMYAEPKWFGLPKLVFCHLLGQIKVEL